MDVHLLRPVEARLDGWPIALGAPKQRAVLAMPALQVGRTVSADRLADGLWGERPPPSAAKMVQLYVSRLRRLVAGNGAEIITRGRGHELRLADGDVDGVRFERLLEDARGREALALWRGAPLCDVADEPFASAEIRRRGSPRAGRRTGDRRSPRGRAPPRGARRARGAARSRAAARAAARAAHADPVPLRAPGGGAGCEARTLLVEQAGVEPGTELRRLQAAILAQDPALDLPAEATAPSPPAASLPPRAVAPVVAATALLVLAASVAFAVSRALRPARLARIDEGYVGLIDAGDGRITAPQVRVGHGAGAMVSGGGSVWVSNALDGTISRIDRERGQVATVDVGGAPAGLAFGEGSLWVADGAGHSVKQLDPGANKLLPPIEAGNAPRAVAVANGALCV